MHLVLLGLDAPDPLADLWNEHLSERLQAPIGDDLPTPGVMLFDQAGLPVLCRLCGGNGHWLPEGLVWVCEHEPIEGVPIRVLDSIRMEKVEAR